MKKLAMALVLGAALCGGIAFAQSQEQGDVRLVPYVKATLGYRSGGESIKTDFGGALPEQKYPIVVRGFEVVPSFGLLLPIQIEQNFGSLTLAAEARVGLSFGSSLPAYGSTGSSFVVDPGIMGIANYYLPKTLSAAVQKLSAHMGVGFSVPITTVSGTMTSYVYQSGEAQEHSYTATGAGFRFDLLFGAQYDFTERLSALVD